MCAGDYVVRFVALSIVVIAAGYFGYVTFVYHRHEIYWKLDKYFCAMVERMKQMGDDYYEKPSNCPRWANVQLYLDTRLCKCRKL